MTHHIIPFSLGGDDQPDNYMALCDDCHKKIHTGDISSLTKLGIKRARTAEVTDILVSQIEILNKILEGCEAGEWLTAGDIVDIIINAKIKKRIHKK